MLDHAQTGRLNRAKITLNRMFENIQPELRLRRILYTARFFAPTASVHGQRLQDKHTPVAAHAEFEIGLSVFDVSAHEAHECTAEITFRQ